MASMAESSTQTNISAVNLITPDDIKPKIRFDYGYLKTMPALLKIAEVVICLTGLICINTIYGSTYHSAGGWYYFVSMTGIWLSLLFLVCYTFHIVERFQWLPWLVTEFIYAVLWVFFFFIASCVSASRGWQDPAWIAAGVLGLVGMCVYGYEAFQRFEKWQRDDVPQGERHLVVVDSNIVGTNEPANVT